MIQAQGQLTIVKDIVVPGEFTVRLYSNTIIDIEWDLSLREVEKSHLVHLKNIIQDFGEGRKMRVYISTIDFMAITSEGRQYSASDEGQEFTLANAVFIDNMAKKLVFNFFLSMNKPKTPTRAFSSKEEAFTWLLQHAD